MIIVKTLKSKSFLFWNKSSLKLSHGLKSTKTVQGSIEVNFWTSVLENPLGNEIQGKSF